MARILVVDDEISVSELLKTFLSNAGHDVSTARDGRQAERALRGAPFDLLITDLKLPDTDGIALFTAAKARGASFPVIVMTAYGGVETAVEAMRQGAFDYVTKPFKIDALGDLVDRALGSGRPEPPGAPHFRALVGESAPMLELYALVEKVARTDSATLVSGESGTGKELVARALHHASPRRGRPFIAINCSALPESLLESELFGYRRGAFTGAVDDKAGLFQTAERGTVFLDEISAMPLGSQAKLLRFLQDKEIRPLGATKSLAVDVRVVAATNEDLEAMTARGLFRQDLFYRLSVIPIQLPPLRARRDDIPLLARHFLQQFNQEQRRCVKFSGEALAALFRHDWPGNVRQLENLVKRLAALCEGDTITERELPEGFAKAEGVISLKGYLKKAERKYINEVLALCGGDKGKAATLLGISLATFYRKHDTKEEECGE